MVGDGTVLKLQLFLALPPSFPSSPLLSCVPYGSYMLNAAGHIIERGKGEPFYYKEGGTTDSTAVRRATTLIEVTACYIEV